MSMDTSGNQIRASIPEMKIRSIGDEYTMSDNGSSFIIDDDFMSKEVRETKKKTSV